MATVSLIWWAIVAGILFVPAVSVVAVWLWARRLGRRPELPRFASWVGYVLATIGAAVVVVGVGSGLIRSLGAVSGESVEPSQKARALAEGISEAMNSGACGFLLAVVAAIWLGFCCWKWRQRG
jgi:Na+/proline symporter